MTIHAAMVDRMDREIGRVLASASSDGGAGQHADLFPVRQRRSAEIMVRDDGHDPAAPRRLGRTHLCLGPGWSTVANTPFRRHKTWVHEGGISTPLIVHWPKGIAARGELRRDPGPRHRHRADDPRSSPAHLGTETMERPAPAPARPGMSLCRPSPATAAVEARRAVVAARRQSRDPRGRLEARRRRQGWAVGTVRPGDRSHGDLTILRASNPKKVHELARRWETPRRIRRLARETKP